MIKSLFLKLLSFIFGFDKNLLKVEEPIDRIIICNFGKKTKGNQQISIGKLPGSLKHIGASLEQRLGS